MRELIQEAFATGYLSIEAEMKLHQALHEQSNLEDLDAFMSLQLATMAGRIRQESLEFLQTIAKSEAINSV
mgnify:CR=1 FL=1